ncbi:MAG: TetR/AcrR family transcriptional regulator [Anaerolineae bacterium]|nr:TetR/AcrR family transcriptional regulator [Anaerolineae bacterium]
MEEPQIAKGEQTRQEILAAAQRLFLSQGFTATPMRQIARQVGITPGAIYNHYSGKDELFTAVLQNAAPYDEVFALWDKIEADSAEDLVRQLFRAALAFVTDHQEYLQLALIDAQERDGVALAAFLPDVLPWGQKWYQRLVALDAGSGQGRLRDVPFVVFVRTLHSLVIGFMLTQRVATPDRVPQMAGIDWAEALADLFLHGVLRPPARDVEGAAST